MDKFLGLGVARILILFGVFVILIWGLKTITAQYYVPGLSEVIHAI